ncbi:MAG: hypothetical protein AB1394_16435, partial [Bacteroidota bacterium]
MDKIKKLLKLFRNIFQTNFIISFWIFLFMLAVYTVLRAGFFLYNSDFYQDIPANQILRAFVYGIRFDIAALLMINLPVLILFNLPFKFYTVKFYRHFFFVLFCIFNLLGIGLNIADYAYYPTIQRRLLFEPFTETLDLIRMAPGLFKNYAPLILAFFLFAALFVWVALKVSKLVEKKTLKQFSYWRASVSLALIILFVVTGIRGGLQLKPIRQTNAFFSDSKPLGYLVLNSTYSVIRCYFQYTFPDYYFYSNDEASSIVTELIKSVDEEMLDKNYPFL